MFGAKTTTQPAEKAGCMDKKACNYDIEATKDNGSCRYSSDCGCMNITACNFKPTATVDDGSCVPVKDGFTCDGKVLKPDGTGAIHFIDSQAAIPLAKGKTHAAVDLPENFEVGFEITPQKTPVKTWSNIIHFTGTGKVR